MSDEVAYFFEWELHSGQEEQFRAAWTVITEAYLQQGSLGSRLLRGEDGRFYAYARWPDPEARARAVLDGEAVERAVAAMKAAIRRGSPPRQLFLEVDRWK